MFSEEETKLEIWIASSLETSGTKRRMALTNGMRGMMSDSMEIDFNVSSGVGGSVAQGLTRYHTRYIGHAFPTSLNVLQPSGRQRRRHPWNEGTLARDGGVFLTRRAGFPHPVLVRSGPNDLLTNDLLILTNEESM